MNTLQHLSAAICIAATLAATGPAFADDPPETPTDAAAPEAPAGDPDKAKADEAARKEADDRRAGRLLDDVLETLDGARKLVDRHDGLPKRTFNPFGNDQNSNNAEIDALIDDAVAMLDSSALADARNQVRVLQTNIRDAHNELAEMRRKRVSAPLNEELGIVDKANPFLTTKEGYDEQIEATEGNIDDWHNELEDQKETFANEMRRLGLKLDGDAVDSLLYSVSGDDFVDMTVVFDNVRAITEQLQTLTEESNEALETAKRYYGMYVVMVRLVDNLQDRFVDQINEQHIPKLEEFADQARENIDEARKLIRKEQGNERILLSNIESNKTTEKAAQLYITYLRDHAQIVAAENKEIEKNLATALNTYKTVKLSSALAELMKSSRKDFDALMQLKVPYLREFRNEQIRSELQRMTEQLRGDN